METGKIVLKFKVLHFSVAVPGLRASWKGQLKALKLSILCTRIQKFLNPKYQNQKSKSQKYQQFFSKTK